LGQVGRALFESGLIGEPGADRVLCPGTAGQPVLGFNRRDLLCFSALERQIVLIGIMRDRGLASGHADKMVDVCEWIQAQFAMRFGRHQS